MRVKRVKEEYLEFILGTPYGLLYISETDADIIDINSGESVLEKL